MGAEDTAYTVKDLVLRVDVKLDRLIEAIAGKASAEAVDALETRVTVLETQSKTTQFILTRVVPAAAAAAGVVATLLAR